MSKHIPKLLQNCKVYINGIDLGAALVDVKLPDLALRSKEHTGGGMYNAIDIVIGGEKLTLSWGVVEYIPELVGTIGAGETQFTFRGYARGADGAEQAVIVYATGMVMAGTGMEHVPGEADYTLTFTMSPTYYELEIDGQSVSVVDVVNAKYIMNGNDLAAGMAEILGS